MPTHSNLPRLQKSAYLGFASVHWIHTIDKRKTGWLTERVHVQIREALLHSLARFKLACPVFCLMPDHMHFLVSGYHEESDHMRFNRRLRNDANLILDPFSLQSQAYDHVLRDGETDKNAYTSIARYILENPVRKGIASSPQSYPFSGSIVPGYFGLNPHDETFWDRYWRIVNRLAANGE